MGFLRWQRRGVRCAICFDTFTIQVHITWRRCVKLRGDDCNPCLHDNLHYPIKLQYIFAHDADIRSDRVLIRRIRCVTMSSRLSSKYLYYFQYSSIFHNHFSLPIISRHPHFIQASPGPSFRILCILRFISFHVFNKAKGLQHFLARYNTG